MLGVAALTIPLVSSSPAAAPASSRAAAAAAAWSAAAAAAGSYAAVRTERTVASDASVSWEPEVRRKPCHTLALLCWMKSRTSCLGSGRCVLGGWSEVRVGGGMCVVAEVIVIA